MDFKNNPFIHLFHRNIQIFAFDGYEHISSGLRFINYCYCWALAPSFALFVPTDNV